MIALDVRPTIAIDLCPHRFANLEEAFLHRSAMDEEIGRRLGGGIDIKESGIGADLARITHLTTRIAIERSTIEHELDMLANFRHLLRAVHTDEGDDGRVRFGGLIPKELGARLNGGVNLAPVALRCRE